VNFELPDQTGPSLRLRALLLRRALLLLLFYRRRRTPGCTKGKHVISANLAQEVAVCAPPNRVGESAFDPVLSAQKKGEIATRSVSDYPHWLFRHRDGAIGLRAQFGRSKRGDFWAACCRVQAQDLRLIGHRLRTVARIP